MRAGVGLVLVGRVSAVVAAVVGNVVLVLVVEARAALQLESELAVALQSYVWGYSVACGEQNPILRTTRATGMVINCPERSAGLKALTIQVPPLRCGRLTDQWLIRPDEPPTLLLRSWQTVPSCWRRQGWVVVASDAESTFEGYLTRGNKVLGPQREKGAEATAVTAHRRIY